MPIDPHHQLRGVLRRLEDPVGAHALAAVLGAAPRDAAFDATAWVSGAPPGARLVAAGAVPWLLVAGPGDPEPLALRLAQRLGAAGRPTLVLALATGDDRLAVALAFGHPRALLLHRCEPSREALAAVARLAWDGREPPLLWAARAVRALDAEEAGRRFFRAFGARLEAMRHALPRRIPAADRHALALTQLTRVLFLYFVQEKGWLDGRPDFLARTVDDGLARRRRLQRDLLRPLFFGTLNRPVHDRSRLARRFGAVPFLNGGLFTPTPLERRWPVDLPDAVWRDAFDLLFERFRFTAHERGDAGAIAPDMLGRVFERVMDPDERHRSGTFYTPAALVHRVLREALTTHVAARLRLGDEAARRRLEARDPDAVAVAAGVTVLDPAAGSGAFLLGALDQLAPLREAQGLAPVAARHAVLAHSLFGVDLSATAVRLAELRLWLAVVASDTSGDVAEVRPLPNLDALVRQGDSLVDPIAAGAHGRPSARAAQRVAAARLALLGAAGTAKHAAIQALRATEREAAGEALDAAAGQLRYRAAELLEVARAPGLFGERPGLDAARCRTLRDLRAGLRRVRALRHRLEAGGEVPWFDYAVQFADVAARGFDLVVGNPPWVRSEQLTPEVRGALDRRYRSWRAHRGRNRPDLAVAFVERGLELLAPGGVLAMLVPAKLATVAYAAPLRRLIATEATLLTVADLTPEAGRAFDATVYPAVLLARRERPAPGARVATALGGGATVRHTRLADGGPWVLSGDPLRRAADRAREGHRTLGELLRPQLGVKTGANACFVGRDLPVEPGLLRGAVRGRDVRPFTAIAALAIVWTHGPDGRPLPVLPPRASRWFGPHLERLRTRADYTGGPPWALFRTAGADAPCRVVWADLARRLAAVALVPGAGEALVPLNTCYVAAAPSPQAARVLAAWLNCTWIRALARLVAPPAAGGFRRHGAAVVAGLPLPSTLLADADLAALADAGTAQADLDDAAARHLDLDRKARDELRRAA